MQHKYKICRKAETIWNRKCIMQWTASHDNDALIATFSGLYSMLKFWSVSKVLEGNLKDIVRTHCNDTIVSLGNKPYQMMRKTLTGKCWQGSVEMQQVRLVLDITPAVYLATQHNTLQCWDATGPSSSWHNTGCLPSNTTQHNTLQCWDATGPSSSWHNTGCLPSNTTQHTSVLRRNRSV